MFGVLVILAVFLKAGGGTFKTIEQATSNPQEPAAQTQTPVPAGSVPVQLQVTGGSGSSGGASNLLRSFFGVAKGILGLGG